MASKKLRKRIKRHARVVRKYAGRAASVVLPIAGAIVAGPAGAAVGTALGTAASWDAEKNAARLKGKKGRRVRKAGRRGIKAGLIRGGLITAGAGAAALVAGGGVTQGLLSTVGLVGNAAKSAAPGAPAGPSTLESDWSSLYDKAPAGGLPVGPAGSNVPAPTGGGILDTVGGVLGGVLGGMNKNTNLPPIEENPIPDWVPGSGPGGVFSPDGPLGAEEGEAEIAGFSVTKIALAAGVVFAGYLSYKTLRGKKRAG